MRRHSLFFLIACLSLLLLPQQALCTHYKLFILTGQSNSLGTTNGGEADPSIGSDPSDQHVIFSWHNVKDASTSIGHSGQTLVPATTTADFTTLQEQQGGTYASSPTHWGPEIEFARGLYRAGVRNFGVIKASRGGGGNSLWIKGSGHMYSHVVDTVNAAVASLDPGDTYEIVGLLYLQGESDSAGEAAEAGNRLKALTDNLRADLANASNLHTVAAGTTASGSSNDVTSRANQKAIADTTSYIDYFSNLDIQHQLSPDNLHLNKAGKSTVGRRFGQAFLDAGLAGISRHYGNLVFIGDSITQGGQGYPSYRYQIFKNLANANVPINAASGYQFVGSISGAYQNNPGQTPDVNGQSFENKHDGHWGWRAMWENGRVALPKSRRGSNRGEGTILNWTGQANPQQYLTDGGIVNFPDLTTSGTGVPSPYTPYTPDTASIMIGINESSVSTAAQVRDDIGTMIDQLRGANPNVRIHLNQLLYSNNVNDSTVDAINTLLPQLVADKNAASNTSPVWLTLANEGFNPTLHTHDNTHPNTAGEIQVGNIISRSLAIIQDDPGSNTPVALAEKAGANLGCYHFEGSDIYNSGSFASNWSNDGNVTPTPTGTSDLQLVNPGAGSCTLNGSNTGWADVNTGPWTFETRIKLNNVANGYMLWLGTGTHRILVEIQNDRTQDFQANSYNVTHPNNDGQFHTFRVTHDPGNSVYHLWRDDVLLTPVAGAPYDATASDARLLMGDYTGGAFGNNFDVTIDYIEYCVGYKGNQIYNGSSYINNWSVVGGVTASLVNTDDLKIVNPGSGGAWLEGTNTGWSNNNDGHWTFEMRAKFNAIDEGFALWLGTGTRIIRVEIYKDRTQDYNNNTFNVSHNNVDGEFHDFRVSHNAIDGVYHVFRDGVRLTPIDGVAYDVTATEERLILGDNTSGTFGNNFDVTIDCINIDYTGVWIPVGTDTDADGMPDTWENDHFDDPTATLPGDDADNDGISNYDEYIADTAPNDANSRTQISDINETDTDNLYDITVANTSTERLYTLYESSDLDISDDWTAVSGPVSGTGGDLTFSRTVSETSFYRVLISLP